MAAHELVDRYHADGIDPIDAPQLVAQVLDSVRGSCNDVDSYAVDLEAEVHAYLAESKTRPD